MAKQPTKEELVKRVSVLESQARDTDQINEDRKKTLSKLLGGRISPRYDQYDRVETSVLNWYEIFTAVGRLQGEINLFREKEERARAIEDREFFNNKIEADPDNNVIS